MKHSTLKTLMLILIISVISLFYLYDFVVRTPLFSPKIQIPTALPVVTHNVKEAKGVDPIWSIGDAHLRSDRLDIALDAAAGKTCFSGGLGAKFKDLVCLNSQDGKVMWRKEIWPSIVFAVTPGGVYVGYDNPGKVAKYNLQDGDTVWKKDLGFFVSGPAYLYFIDNEIQVLSSNDKFFVLDTDGNIINTLSRKSIFISNLGQTVVKESGLKVYDAKTNELLWEYIDPRLLYQPLFTSDKIFVSGGDTSQKAYALNRKTGRLLWTSSSIIVGGLAYSPDRHLIYALSNSGNLLAIDENTGQQTLLAKFVPIPFDLTSPQISSYQIAYDQQEHIITVALGDSHQIFAFKEK